MRGNVKSSFSATDNDITVVSEMGEISNSEKGACRLKTRGARNDKGIMFFARFPTTNKPGGRNILHDIDSTNWAIK